jgi:hypothetical protein
VPSRTVAAAVAVLLAGLLTVGGCGLADGDDEPGAGGERTTPEPDRSATMPTEVPSWLLECGAEDDKERDTELQLAAIDLTTATWSMPAGFTASTSYVEDNPVEALHSTWYAVPTQPAQPTLNVIQVVIYTGLDWDGLADGCGRVPLAAIEEKLAQYREQIGAEPLGEAEMTTLAGHPAIHQDIGLSRYSYTGWWLFSETQLLHLYCQWTPDGDRAVIERGCDDLVSSLQVG